mmetsp:Transcript_46371/g.119675  ORF Transcript_46371/g.119675 Transcript_46371/m.119675 type:complete len:295 (-) Transcript_46371:295-1179(-)|eukprot:CAMPEP_0113895052 /NCGR_PEP_ID=MMETSP0780_2-20120614/17115_1 /TAXON_ID=652834 /ORGANISM="Palpitomonas bilix" /LENGTH=294 /DNA_ID=CAMNT_0000885773 /DNA_START=80 /DNA_END=964 /DNA_ORIENTATION=- /assembly_acc=CAM_ASM_000599
MAAGEGDVTTPTHNFCSPPPSFPPASSTVTGGMSYIEREDLHNRTQRSLHDLIDRLREENAELRYAADSAKREADEVRAACKKREEKLKAETRSLVDKLMKESAKAKAQYNTEVECLAKTLREEKTKSRSYMMALQAANILPSRMPPPPVEEGRGGEREDSREIADEVLARVEEKERQRQRQKVKEEEREGERRGEGRGRGGREGSKISESERGGETGHATFTHNHVGKEKMASVEVQVERGGEESKDREVMKGEAREEHIHAEWEEQGLEGAAYCVSSCRDESSGGENDNDEK